MKILVTGGAGFIGSHIVDAYIQLGHKVAVFDDLSTGDKKNLNPSAKFYKVDVLSKKAVDLLGKIKPDVINHHAAQIDMRKSVKAPIYDARINILGLLNLLEAVKTIKIKKVIFASSGGTIYGDTKRLPTSEDFDAWPQSPYGISKLTCEYYLNYYYKNYKIPFVSLRYGNVYGPRQNPHGEAGVVAIFTNKLLGKIIPTINGDGKQTRDFIFVEDVVAANKISLEKNIAGIFNIGTGRGTSVNTIFKKLKKLLNSDVQAKYAPAEKGEQRRSALDFSKANKELGWQPKTNLSKGLSKTIDYFKDR